MQRRSQVCRWQTTQCQSFEELTGHDSKAIRCGPEFVSGFSCSNRKYLYQTHTCCRPTRTTSEAHKARKTPVQPIFTQDRKQHSESFFVSTHPMWMLQQGDTGLRLFCAEWLQLRWISGEECVRVSRRHKAHRKYDSARSKQCAMWNKKSMEEEKWHCTMVSHIFRLKYGQLDIRLEVSGVTKKVVGGVI